MDTRNTSYATPPSDYRLRMRFGVLGPVQISDKGRRLSVGGPKQRTVLALLIARTGESVSTDALMQGVYGDDAPPGSRRSVQTYISNLRGEIGDVITATGSGYTLAAERSEVDAFVFEDMVNGSTDHSDPEATSSRLREALALWRGHPFADVDGMAELTTETARLNELRASALEERVGADLELGRHRDLIAELESLTEEYPLRERFRSQQMLALYRSGRQAEALRAYEKTRTYLVEEMGLDPSRELRDLEQRILEQDPTLAFETGPTVRRAAVLVADVADPRMLPNLDPADRAELIRLQNEALEDAAATNGGTIFAQRGSALYLSFDDVDHAVGAASAAQQALAEIRHPMRMAISVGEVQIPQDGSVQGPPVTRAAQLVAAAYGGQVLLSVEANQALVDSGAPGWIVRSLGQHDVDGSGQARAVYQLMVDGLPREFPPLRSELLPPPLPIEVRGLPGYELREQVGTGAFGVVHRAYQPSVGREVAIKIIKPEYANDPEFIRHFEVEAQLVARLEHPHIVPLHDYWRSPEGAYLVMRWLGGGTLKDRIAAGRLTIDEAHGILADIGPALAFAHRRGVVHRDIKLSNVLLDDEGGAYLSDFGIASDITRHGAGSVAQDVQGLAVVMLQCVGDVDESTVAKLLANATATESFPDVHSFIAAWEEAVGAGDDTSQAVGFTPTRNPYKGLSAFGELDAADFHGRDTEIDEIVTTLADHPMVAVVGPSGIGKSSVVRAGVIPALRSGAIPGSEQWLITDMLPGTYPYEELTSALMRVATEMPSDLEEDLRRDARGLARSVKRYVPEGQTVLLIVDQFEELFTLSGEDERSAFLAMLAATIGDERTNVRIVITMRADFFDRPLRFADLGDALRAGTIPISAPDDEALHAIVTEPAAGVGVGFEPGLVDRIIADVKDQPGALPLLEFALTELFEQRDSDLLTLEAYETSGGVLGALGRRAESIYTDLDDRGRDAARETFLRLVNVSEAGRDTRRRVRLSELERLGFTDVVLRGMLNAFGDHRLLTFDRDPITRGPTVEVAHEAILTEWPRLAAWIEEHREDLLLRSRLAAAVGDWETADRADAYLLTGGRLDQHETWTANTELTLTTAEQEYLTASRTRADQERATRRRRRRLIMTGFAAAALIAAVLAVAALVARNESARQAEIAEANETTAEDNAALAEAKAVEAETEKANAQASADLARSRELAAAAITELDRDPELSLLLAIQAAEQAEPTIEATSALTEALGQHRAILTYTWPDDYGGSFLWGDISPDGTKLVVASVTAPHVQVVDVDSGTIIWESNLGEDVSVFQPFFIKNGTEIVLPATYTAKGEPPDDFAGLTLMDASDGSVLKTMDFGGCGVLQAGFWGRSDDFVYGGLLPPPCGPPDDPSGPLPPLPIQRIDLESGETRQILDDWDFRINPSSDEGKIIFSGGGEPYVIDSLTGDRLFTAPEGASGQIAGISPDGELVVYDRNLVIEVAEISTGNVVSRYFGHNGGYWNAWFTPDGKTMFSSGPNGTFELWDPLTGENLLTVPYGGSVGWSAVSSDLSRAAAFSFGNTVKVFDITPDFNAALTNLYAEADCDDPSFESFSLQVMRELTTATVVCGNDDQMSRVRILDTASGEAIGSAIAADGQGGRLSPDGSLVVAQESSGGMSESVTLFDSRSGEVVRVLEGLCARSFEGESGPDCASFPSTPFPDAPKMFRFSPDGTKLAMLGSMTNGITVWDVSSGTIVATLEGEGDTRQGIEFSPDGTRLLVGSTAKLAVYETDSWSIVTERNWDEGDGITPGGNLRYLPDGSAIVAAPDPWWGPSDISILDAEDLSDIRQIEGTHDGGIRTLAVSSDGSLVATGGMDGFVRVWDVVSGSLVAEIALTEHEPANNVAFISADSQLLVTSAGGPVAIASLDAERQLENARSALTRSFTQPECDTYRIDPCPTLEEIGSS